MPDRYADAVQARRAELRAELEALGAHRTELRAEVALARLAALRAAAEGVRALAREAHQRVDTADRRARQALPEQVDTAAMALSSEIAAALGATIGPAVRRLAGARGVPTPPGRPAVPAAHPPRVPGAWPQHRPALTRLLDGTAAGLAAWRLLLVPTAALPVLGLPIVAGPALLPLAIGLVAAGVGTAVRARLVAADRALLHRGVDDTLTAVRLATEADVTRRLMELERTAGIELDRAVERRRAEVEHELRSLIEEVASA